jgi:Tol biopolymer transport system component
MTLTATILVVMLSFAGTPAEESPAALDEFELAQSNATSDSRTKPVSEPLARSAMDLSKIPYKIVHDTYRETGGKRNHEIFIMNADGSNPVNLTNTPDIDEMYPHVSPDGTKICFVTDEGRSRRDKVRHIYYMDLDGTNRVHVVAHGREPCWSFDSKSIAYVKSEYERFSTREYATTGLAFYHIDNDWHQPHMNTELHHVYAICWSPDSKWFVAAVEGGMGYSDTIIAFEAFGKRVFDLEKWGVRGCRPDLNSDATRMVWGETDWNLQTGEIDLNAPEPKVTNVHDILRVARQYKVYHVDISPDSKYIAFSYGPVSGGQQVGGMAEGWNICVGDLDGNWVQITTDGLHNKEPDWVPVKN